MPLANLHTLTADDYAACRRALLQRLEGYGESPYFDSANPPLITIGVGFNINALRTDVRTRVFEAMGLSIAEQHSIDEAWIAPRMAQIRAMPAGAVRNQALQTYLDGVVNRRAFEMTPAEISMAFLNIVTPHQTAIEQLIVTWSLRAIGLGVAPLQQPNIGGQWDSDCAGIRRPLRSTCRNLVPDSLCSC